MILILIFFIINFLPLFSLDNIKIYKDYPEIDNFILKDANVVNPNFNGEFNAASKLIKNNNIVFDIGANVGEYTHKLINNYNKLRIYSFEPAPQIFNILQNNIKQNKIENSKTNLEKNHSSKKLILNINNNQIFLNNIAISNHNGIRKFYFYSNVSVISGLYHFSGFDRLANSKPQEFNVTTIKLDTYCIQNNIEKIDYLKIDTEGSDYDVLLSANNLLKNKKISIIQFEYMEAYKSANATLKDVCFYLTKHGYKIFKIVPDGLVHISTWRDSLENYLYSNFIAIIDINWNLMSF